MHWVYSCKDISSFAKSFELLWLIYGWHCSDFCSRTYPPRHLLFCLQYVPLFSVSWEYVIMLGVREIHEIHVSWRSIAALEDKKQFFHFQIIYLFQIHFLSGFYVPSTVLRTKKHVENYIDTLPLRNLSFVKGKKEKVNKSSTSVSYYKCHGKMYHICIQMLGKVQTKVLNQMGQEGDLFIQQTHGKHPLCSRNYHMY